MKCQHRHHTLVRGHLEDGEPVAIHQCDNCGVALPSIDPEAVDVWTLPEFDAKASERGYRRLVEIVFEVVEEKLAKAVQIAKGLTHDRNRNVR